MQFRKLADKAKYAALVPGVFLMNAAMAQEGGEGGGVAESVTSVVETSIADVKTIGVAIIGVVVAVVAFNWIRRVIR